MQRRYIEEINKCAALNIDPLNPDPDRYEVNVKLLHSMKFLHKFIFENNGTLSIDSKLSQEKHCELMKQSSRTSKLYQNVSQSVRSFREIDTGVELEKENCMHIVRDLLLDIPTDLKSKYFLESSFVLRDIGKKFNDQMK